MTALANPTRESMRSAMTDAVSNLQSCRYRANRAAIALLQARQALTDAEQSVLRTNANDLKVLGSNDAIRVANIAALTETQRIAMDDAEIEKRIADCELACALDTWQLFREERKILFPEGVEIP